MALSSGWVFLVGHRGHRSDSGGSSQPDAGAEAESKWRDLVAAPRFMALVGRKLVIYRRDPHQFPDEEPASVGLLQPGTVFQDLGRRQVDKSQALHVFSISSPGSEQGRKIGCSSAKAAKQWLEALEAAAASAPVSSSQPSSLPSPVSAGEDGTDCVVSIGKEEEAALTGEGGGVEVGSDAVETTQWRLIKLVNGLRLFEALLQPEEAMRIRLLKSEGVVDASPDQVFEVFMSTNTSVLYQWDPLTVESEVLKTLDGYAEIFQAIVSAPTKGRPILKELNAKRTWRRDEDGSYVITTLPVDPEEASFSSNLKYGKLPRMDSAVSNVDIVPLSPPGSTRRVRSLVRIVLEVQLKGHNSLLTHATTSPAHGTGGGHKGPSLSPAVGLSLDKLFSGAPRGSKEKEGGLFPWMKDKDKDKERERREKEKDGSHAGEKSEKRESHHFGWGAKDKEPSSSTTLAAPASALSWPLAGVPYSLHGFWAEQSLEDFADGIPYTALCRTAGLREYFAAQPVVGEEQGALVGAAKGSSFQQGSTRFVRSLTEASNGSVDENFFDAEDFESNNQATNSAKIHMALQAKKNWQSLKMVLQFNKLLGSLEAQGEGVPWEVRRELLHNVPRVELETLKAQLDALESVAEARTAEAVTTAKHSWRDPGGDNFCIRGPSYLQDHLKVPASTPLMHLVAVDWFKAEERIDNVCSRPGSLAQTKAGKALPFLFAVNLQVPGPPCYSLVAYFAADRPVRGTSLLHKFVSAPEDSYRNTRFKLIPRIAEGHWMVKRAVGSKACILGKALKCSYHKGANYMEMDCDIGSSAVARNVIGLVISYVTTLVVDLAILIEAQEQDELPEYLLGAFTCIRIDPKQAVDPPPVPTESQA